MVRVQIKERVMVKLVHAPVILDLMEITVTTIYGGLTRMRFREDHLQ